MGQGRPYSLSRSDTGHVPESRSSTGNNRISGSRHSMRSIEFPSSYCLLWTNQVMMMRRRRRRRKRRRMDGWMDGLIDWLIDWWMNEYWTAERAMKTGEWLTLARQHLYHSECCCTRLLMMTTTMNMHAAWRHGTTTVGARPATCSCSMLTTLWRLANWAQFLVSVNNAVFLNVFCLQYSPPPRWLLFHRC